MSPAVVPTRSQTVAHATYSNVTRTVAGSTDGAAIRLGSRIRVLIVVITRAGKSKVGANPKLLVFFRDRLWLREFLTNGRDFPLEPRRVVGNGPAGSRRSRSQRSTSQTQEYRSRLPAVRAAASTRT